MAPTRDERNSENVQVEAQHRRGGHSARRGRPRLDSARAKEISDEALRYNGRKHPTDEPPPLFSNSFMEVLGQAINEGRISARRAANLLDLTIEDLVDLFTEHAVEAPLDL